MLTRAHHNLNKEFLQFKIRNDELIDERDFIHKKWIACELDLAMKAPVREAEYGLDEKSPLKLYDCLLPLIKEFRRKSLNIGAKVTIADYQAQREVL